jgi:hypothetical protein
MRLSTPRFGVTTFEDLVGIVDELETNQKQGKSKCYGAAPSSVSATRAPLLLGFNFNAAR